MRRFKLMFVVFIASVLAALPVRAEAPLSATQKQQVEKMIADYFMRNPEALGTALDNMQAHYRNLEEERKKATLRNNSNDIFYAKGDFSMGPKDAPITIVEFFDYNCGYCKRAFDPLMQVLKENKDVRLVFKELPILNEGSRTAARAALGIEDKKKFLSFHAKLMTHKGSINDALIERTLTELKLSPSAIRKAGNSSKVNTVLARNNRVSSLLGITGTPAFIINDNIYPGALSKEEFTQAINKARADLTAKN